MTFGVYNLLVKQESRKGIIQVSLFSLDTLGSVSLAAFGVIIILAGAQVPLGPLNVLSAVPFVVGGTLVGVGVIIEGFDLIVLILKVLKKKPAPPSLPVGTREEEGPTLKQIEKTMKAARLLEDGEEKTAILIKVVNDWIKRASVLGKQKEFQKALRGRMLLEEAFLALDDKTKKVLRKEIRPQLKKLNDDLSYSEENKRLKNELTKLINDLYPSVKDKAKLFGSVRGNSMMREFSF